MNASELLAGAGGGIGGGQLQQQQGLQQPSALGAGPLAGSGMGVGGGGMGMGAAALAGGSLAAGSGKGIGSAGASGIGPGGFRELPLQGLDPKHNRTMALPAGGYTGIGQSEWSDACIIMACLVSSSSLPPLACVVCLLPLAVGALRIRPVAPGMSGTGAAGAPIAGTVPVAGALPVAGQQQPILQQQQVLPPAQTLASGTTTGVGSGIEQGGGVVPGSKLGMVGQVQSATDAGVTAPKTFVESGTVVGQGQDPASVRRY